MPAGGDDGRDVGLAELVGTVVDDAKAVARAELDVVRAKAAAKAGRYKAAGIWFGIAAAFLFCAAVALAVGVLLVLTVLIGPLLATVAATLGFGLLGYFAARLGMSRL